MFREFGIHVDSEEIFTRFKGVKLYEIINIISKEQGVTMIGPMPSTFTVRKWRACLIASLR